MYDAILNGADEEYAKWDMRGRILDNQSTADIIKIVDSDHQRIALSPSIFVAAYGNAGLQSKESALGIYLLESNSDCSNSYHDSFLKLAGSQVFSDAIKDDNLKCILDSPSLDLALDSCFDSGLSLSKDSFNSIELVKEMPNALGILLQLCFGAIFPA